MDRFDRPYKSGKFNIGISCKKFEVDIKYKLILCYFVKYEYWGLYNLNNNTKTIINLQDIFLNQIRKEHIPVTIYLLNGFQIKGTVKGFDNFTIILESENKQQQMVYKHALSTISPLKPILFTNDNNNNEKEEQN